jgi:GR25 family glycosyltransferase involved in LPS biosynthesis
MNLKKKIILIICCLLIFITLFLSQTHFNLKENFNYVNNKSSYIRFIVMKTIPERTKNINNIINLHSLNNASIFDAVIGKNLDNDQLFQENKITEFTKNKIKPGAIGCTLSHIYVWQEFMESNQGNLLVVMEDDIDLPNDFKEKLNNFIINLPRDFDIAQIYHSKTTEKHKYPPKKVNNFVLTGYPQNGTVGYIISKKGINKLLDHCLPIYEAIDVMIKDAIRQRKIISYVPKEELILHKFKFESSVCDGGKTCNSKL